MDKDSGRSKKREKKKKKKKKKDDESRSGHSKHHSNSRGRSKSTDDRKAKNKCKHCKEDQPYAGKHDEDKCLYKKYKGWHPSKICKESGVKFKRRHEYSLEMGAFASSASEESSSDSDINSGATSDEWRRGGSEDEKWIEVRGKKTNKSKEKKLVLSNIKLVTPNKYTALATYIEDTPSPPERSPNDNRTLATRTHEKKRPTQKHVRHTLRLLAQQESDFLERSITRAENKTTELVKRDKTNKQRISIEEKSSSPEPSARVETKG